MNKNTEGQNSNQEYWDSLAKTYDSLYESEWSKLENRYILSKLQSLITSGAKVLDLGCGTGLAFKMCLRCCKDVDYIGLDLSENMLSVFNSNYPQARTVLGTMEDLSMFSNATFDFVISTFSAFSFANNCGKVVSEIERVLKPGGVTLISCLSKYSLRRLIRFKLSNFEMYHTRGSADKNQTNASVLTEGSLRKMFSLSGFQTITVEGYNAFGGIEFLEAYKRLWNFSLLISRFLPSLSHEFIVKAQKCL